MRLQNLLLLGGLMAVGVYLGQRGAFGDAPRRVRRRAAAYAQDLRQAYDRDYGRIRPAGRENTRDDRDRWDEVDQASDESFPASDPPATY